MSINAIMGALVDELAAVGMTDPLAEPLTLAHVWYDLARLAGEPVPADVAALLDAPLPIRPFLPAPKPTRRLRAVAESYPCASCGKPSGEAVLDAETCIALCPSCWEAAEEYARDVALLRR